MSRLLRLEEAFMFGLAVFAFSRLDYAWWLFPLLLFAPDLSMLAYLGGPRLGAYIYNFIHHRGLAISLFAIGLLATSPLLQLVGIMLFAHSSLDRVFGYGLKYPDAFEHTHLGLIGKSSQVSTPGEST